MKPQPEIDEQTDCREAKVNPCNSVDANAWLGICDCDSFGGKDVLIG